ncbi:MAG: DUF655 domain-containing protein [Candidatus Caldarchaeales archaeon]
MYRYKKYEDFAYVLDLFSPENRPTQQNIMVGKNELIAQLLGEQFFTLLEAAISSKHRPMIGIRMYIGRDVPRSIIRIIRRIRYDDLTQNAKNEIPNIVRKIVESDEKRFIEFFNVSTPVTPRMHALELIPGIGKKIALKILEEREIQSFSSYEDLKKRVGLQDPIKALTNRILYELMNVEERHRIFVREPISQAREI